MKGKLTQSLLEKHPLFLAFLFASVFSPSITATTEQVSPPSSTETSSSTPSLPLERIFPNMEKQKSHALVDHFERLQQTESVVWLGEEQDSFLAIYGRDTTGRPQGAIIVIHDESHQPEWPNVITPLREHLPLYGWATLSIAVPTTERPPIPNRPDKTLSTDIETKTETHIETETQNKVDDNEPSSPEKAAVTTDNASTSLLNAKYPHPAPAEIHKEIYNRIELAIEYANSQGFYNLALAGYGVGGAWAGDYLAFTLQQMSQANKQEKDLPQDGYGLILIDAKNPIHNTSISIETALGQIHFPILDLIQQHKSIQDDASEARRLAARRFLRTNYIQIRLPPKYTNIPSKNRLVKRIRGWLKMNLAGKEVSVN